MGFSAGFNKWLQERGEEPCNPELSAALDESFARLKANPQPLIDGACELVNALLDARDGHPEKLQQMVAEAKKARGL